MSNSIFNKNILISGIDGFVGSHLESYLKKNGANVFGISNIQKRKNVLFSNILDYKSIYSFVKKNNIAACVHLAGITIVEKGQEDPYETFQTNILGTLNILEMSRLQNLEKIIIASTSHVYGTNKVPYYEGYPPRPSRPYETSKTSTDLIAQSYADSFGLPVLIPRFVNIYGPGDFNFSRVIPKTVRSIVQNGSVKMWGGDAVRDYLYIDDVTRAYKKLLECDMVKIKGNRIFNFGSGMPISVSALIAKIIELSGKDVNIKKIVDVRELEIKSQYVSWNKSAKLLKWKPKITLDYGLKKTIEWYKSHLNKR